MAVPGGDAAPALLDRVYAMSSTTPARLGARAGELERDSTALIDNIASCGVLTEVICSTALVARRPNEEIVP